MALIRCPECQREVSDRAPACPQCGYPIAGGQQSVPQRPQEPIRIYQKIDDGHTLYVKAQIFVAIVSTIALAIFMIWAFATKFGTR